MAERTSPDTRPHLSPVVADAPPAPDLVSMREAARFLAVPDEAVEDALRRDSVPLITHGDGVFVARNELATFRERDDVRREQGLLQIIRISEEAGFYDLEPYDPNECDDDDEP